MNNFERLVFYYFAGRVFIPLPRNLVYNATNRCDLSCRHCGVWEGAKREELSADAVGHIIGREFFRKIEMVWFTGGEPTLRRDLKNLVRIFCDRVPSMRMLGIATNGFATERIIQRIEETLLELNPVTQGLFIHLSLDGLGEVHDFIRGKKGAFAGLESTLAMINRLKQNYPDRRIEMGFNCVIQKRNIEQLAEIKKFAQSNNASLTFNIVEITDQYYFNKSRAEELALSDAERKKVMDFFIKIIPESPPALKYQYRRILSVLSGKKRDRRCLSLYSTFVIDSDGSYIPCPLSSEWLRVDFLKIAPEKFWRSQELSVLRKKVEQTLCPACMLSCSLGDSLSISEFITGGF